MLVYKINVIDTLKESGYNSTRILKENILSQSAMQKLRRGIWSELKHLNNYVNYWICNLEILSNMWKAKINQNKFN